MYYSALFYYQVACSTYRDHPLPTVGSAYITVTNHPPNSTLFPLLEVIESRNCEERRVYLRVNYRTVYSNKLMQIFRRLYMYVCAPATSGFLAYSITSTPSSSHNPPTLLPYRQSPQNLTQLATAKIAGRGEIF